MKLRSLGLLLLLLCSVAAQAAQYTLTADPANTTEDTTRIYAPVLDQLATATGDSFTLNVPRNYPLLWRDLRDKDVGEFILAEPHFADYLLQRGGYTALAATQEPTQYIVVASKEQAAQGKKGLIGQRISAMMAPSLGQAVLAELFSDPVGQPEVWSSATSWKQGLSLMNQGETAAAVIPAYLRKPDQGVIFEGVKMPGRVVLASTRVPEATRQKVTATLLALGQSQDKAVQDALSSLGTQGFVATSARAYAGQEVILRYFFGYTPLPGTVLPPLIPALLDTAPAATPAAEQAGA